MVTKIWFVPFFCIIELWFLENNEKNTEINAIVVYVNKNTSIDFKQGDNDARLTSNMGRHNFSYKQFVL